MRLLLDECLLELLRLGHLGHSEALFVCGELYLIAPSSGCLLTRLGSCGVYLLLLIKERGLY
jgi:hypothetical protein